MLDNSHKGSGCLKCPMNEFDCDAQHRGSRCAAIRAKARIDSDPRTNADRIRAMSDEELAQTLNIAVCPPSVFLPFTSCNEGQGCMKCWMNWLQQPAPEEDVNNGRPNL